MKEKGYTAMVGKKARRVRVSDVILGVRAYDCSAFEGFCERAIAFIHTRFGCVCMFAPALSLSRCQALRRTSFDLLSDSIGSV